MTARRFWSPTVGARLTNRQREYVRRTATGESWRQIATALGISINGVGSLSRQVRAKLGAHNDANIVHLAHEAGLLPNRPERHGDHAGYMRHKRAGEEPRDCPRCHAGELAYRAQLRAARTTTKEQRR